MRFRLRVAGTSAEDRGATARIGRAIARAALVVPTVIVMSAAFTLAGIAVLSASRALSAIAAVAATRTTVSITASVRATTFRA